MAAVDVNPVVRPPLRLIDPTLNHADLEAGEQRLPHLGLAVAVPVREKNDVRCTNRDDTVACRAYTEAGGDAVHPGLDAIHHAVAVVIYQFLDRANLLGLSTAHRILVGGDAADHTVEFTGLVQLLDVELPLAVVAVQLGDEEVALRIPADAGRLADERFGGDQLEAKPVRQLDGLEAFGGRERLGGIGRFGDLAKRLAKRSEQQAQNEKSCQHLQMSGCEA